MPGRLANKNVLITGAAGYTPPPPSFPHRN